MGYPNSGLVRVLGCAALSVIAALSVASSAQTPSKDRRSEGLLRPPEVQQPGTGVFWTRCAMGQSWSGTACTGAPALSVASSAQAACPVGYRLPTRAEFIAMYGSCSPGVTTGAAGVCTPCATNPTCRGFLAGNETCWTAASAGHAGTEWAYQVTAGTIQLVNASSAQAVRCLRYDAAAGPATPPSPASGTSTAQPTDQCTASAAHLPQPLPTLPPATTGADMRQELFEPQTNICWMRCPVGSAWNGATCASTGSSARASFPSAAASCPPGFRLPTRREIARLLGCNGAMIDGGNSGACLRCSDSAPCKSLLQGPSSWVWTSTPFGSNGAWMANPLNGYIAWTFRADEAGLRCVRSPGGSPAPADSPAATSGVPGALNAAIEVAQANSSLTWMRCPVGQQWLMSGSSLDVGSCAREAKLLSWDEAQTACPTGYRLPTKEELVKAVCPGYTMTCASAPYTYDVFGTSGPLPACSAAAPCKDMLKDDKGYRYWSATPHASPNAWAVAWGSAGSSAPNRAAKLPVRCVRKTP